MSDLSAAAFGPNIRQRRLDLGWTRLHLSVASGVCQSVIFRTEKGDGYCYLATAVSLCTALGLTADEALAPGGEA